MHKIQPDSLLLEVESTCRPFRAFDRNVTG